MAIEERLEIKYVVLQLKKLKEQTKHKGKKMIKTRAEISELKKKTSNREN